MSQCTCCGTEIMGKIIKRVQDSIMYSIMFDETTDVTHESKLALVLRYVHDGKLCEDFLLFVSLRQASNKSLPESNQETMSEPAVTGQDVGLSVLVILRSHGFNPKNCVEIGTDGGSAMVSEANGAVAEVWKEATNAVKCSNRTLNLSISKLNKNTSHVECHRCNQGSCCFLHGVIQKKFSSQANTAKAARRRL